MPLSTLADATDSDSDAEKKAIKASGKSFLIFYSSRDENNRMWCPDCRDVEDIVKNAFNGATDTDTKSSSEDGTIIYVGQRSEWKTPTNKYRAAYQLGAIPTIIRFQDGKETGRLVESEITETNNRLTHFVHG